MTDWSEDQLVALDAIGHFLRNGEHVMRLGGLAGTGKTTLVSGLADAGLDIRYCAPTGKAADVLATKIRRPTSTVHSLLGLVPFQSVDPHEEGCSRGEDCVCFAGKPDGWGQGGDPPSEAHMIVVDEASMLQRWLYDLLMQLGPKIMLVGDYGQLPPVGEKYSAVAEDVLDIRLRHIHRQAQDNPIVRAAWAVRETGRWSDDIRVVRRQGKPFKVSAEGGRMVIVGRNRTRQRINKQMRAELGLPEGKVVVGDRVICLRNERRAGVYNGQQGTVIDIREDRHPNMLWLTADMDTGRRFAGRVVAGQFGQEGTLENPHGALFDWAYALTCHKAQGSEADSVVVVDEPIGRGDDVVKWRYTAVTRAKQQVMVVVP